jgi:hypothetical protein
MNPMKIPFEQMALMMREVGPFKTTDLSRV